MRRILFAAWSLPVLVLGALASLALWPLEGRPRLRDGALVTVCRGPLARWQARRGWAGFTLGGSVFLWLDDRALDHEMRHVRQWRALGVLFPVVYLLFLAAFGYRDNPLEVDARSATKGQ